MHKLNSDYALINIQNNTRTTLVLVLASKQATGQHTAFRRQLNGRLQIFDKSSQLEHEQLKFN